MAEEKKNVFDYIKGLFKGNESNKQAIQNINRSGTVSGKASGVSNISGKIVTDNSNASNLAGNNRQQALGTPKMSTPSITNFLGKPSTPSAPVATSFIPSSSNPKSNQGTRNLIDTARSENSKPKEQKQERVSESNPYKNNYTTDDYNTLKETYAEAVDDSHYKALWENVDYKDLWSEEDKQYFDNYNNYVQELGTETKVAKAHAGLEKELEETSEGLVPNDVVQFDEKGNGKLIDFTKDAESIDDEFRKLEAKNKELEYILANAEFSIPTEDYNRYKAQSDSIKNRMDQLAEQRDLITRKQKYQDALVKKSNFEWYKENGTRDEFLQMADIAGSYLNNTLEDIALNYEASQFRKLAGVTTFVETVKKSYGDAKAKEITDTITKLYKDGDVSKEEYDEVIKYAESIVAKNSMENSLGLQMNDVANQLTEMQLNGESATKKLVVNVVGDILDNTIGQFGPATVAGKAGMLASTAYMSFSEYASKYQQDIEQGYTHEQAMMDAGFGFLTEYLTERIGGERILHYAEGDIVPRSIAELLKENLKSGLAEVTEEGLGWLVSPLTHAMATSEMPSIENWSLEELKEATTTAFLAGFLQAGMMADYSQLGTEAPLSMTERTLSNFLRINTAEGKKRVQDFIVELDNMATDASIRENVLLPDGTKMSEKDYIGIVKNIAEREIRSYDDRSQVKGVEIIDPARPNGIQSLAEDSRYALKDSMEIARQQQIQSLNESLNAGETIQTLNEKMAEEVDKRMVAEESARLAEIQEQLNKDGVKISATKWNELDDNAKNNVTIVSKVSDIIGGTPIEFADLRAKDGSVIDGFYDNGRIIVNPNANLGAISTFIHEYTHGIESSKFYSALRAEVEAIYGKKGFKEKVKAVMGQYADLKQLSEEEAEKELTAITVQDLLGNKEFVSRLVKYHTDMAYKMYTDLKSMTTYSTVAESMAQTFMQAFAENDVELNGADEKAMFSYSMTLKDLASRIAPLAFNQETGKFRGILTQLKNLRADPVRTQHVFIPVGKTLSFAGVPNSLAISRTDLTHIEGHVDDATIDYLIHNLDNNVVLALDYKDRRSNNIKKDVILEQDGKHYVLALYKNPGMDRSGYKIANINTLFEENDGNDFEDTVGGLIYKNLSNEKNFDGQKPYYYANEKSSDFLKRLGLNSLEAVRSSTALDLRIPNERRGVKFSKGLTPDQLREEAHYNTGNVDVDALMNDIVDSMSEEELRNFLDNGEFTYASQEEVEEDPEVQEEGLWVKEPEGDYIKIDDGYISDGKTVAWKDERIDAIIEENEKGNFAFSGHDPYQYHYAINLSPREYRALSYIFEPSHDSAWHHDIKYMPNTYNNGEVNPSWLGGNYDSIAEEDDPKNYRYKRKIDYIHFDGTYDGITLQIDAQEGNHRSIILDESGYTKMPVLIGTSKPLKGVVVLKGMDAREMGIANPNKKILTSNDYVELKSKNRDELIKKFGSGAKADIQYSKSLTPSDLKSLEKDYNKAVEENDMETAQEIVKNYAEDYAKKTGQEVYEGYHGTNAVFNEFLKEKLGSKNFLAESAYMGFFMAGSRETAESYTGLNSADMFKLNFDPEMEGVRRDILSKYNVEELRQQDKIAEQAYLDEALERDIQAGDEDAVFVRNLRDGREQLIEALNGDEKAYQELVDRFVINWRIAKHNGVTNYAKYHNEYAESEQHKALKEAERLAGEDYEKAGLERLGYSPNIKHLFAFMENPLVHDFKNEGRDVDFSALMKEAKQKGHDGVIFQNVQDGGDFDTIYAVFEPNQFKSADPVTYDDNGNVIPLSERFNPETNDIRYSKSLKPEDLKKKPKVQKYYATIAPYLDTRLNAKNREQLIELAEKSYDGMAKEIANELGIELTPKRENIGGFENDEGKKLRELSWTYDLGEIDSNRARLFTSLMGDLAFENQEAVICMRYLNEGEEFKGTGETGPDGGTYGMEHGLSFRDLETVENALKKADIANYNIDRETNYLTVQDFGFDPSFPEKLKTLLEDDNYDSAEERQIYSYYLSREDRQSLYGQGLDSEIGVREEGNESNLSGRISEAKEKVTDVINKKASGQESPFLRRPEVQRLQQNTDDLNIGPDDLNISDADDLNASEKELNKYGTISNYTDREHYTKGVDSKTGVVKPSFIVTLDTTLDKTTHQEEIEDAEKFAGTVAERLDKGQDVQKAIRRLKDNPLKNGVLRAYYTAQVLYDHGEMDEFYKLAQWARDVENYGGKLIESTKVLYDLDDEFSRAVYVSKVQQNLIDEHTVNNPKNKDQIEDTINELFQKYSDDIINAKTTRAFRTGLGRLTRACNDVLPKSIWSRLKQFRMLSMLSGVKTPIANMESNLATTGLYRMMSKQQALLESALKKATFKTIDGSKTYEIKTEDRKSTLWLDKNKTKVNQKLAEQEWANLKEDLKSKYDTGVEKIPEKLKEQLHLNNKKGIAKAVDTAFDFAENVQSTILSDTPFAHKAFVTKFNELAQARNMDLSTIDKKSKTYNRLVDDAWAYAEEVVSHDETAISKTIANITRNSASNVRINNDTILGGMDQAVKTIKEKANQGQPLYKFIDSAMKKTQQWFVPFYKTNASLLKKTVQFSPLEWFQVGNDYKKVKAGKMDLVDMVEHMAKALTGTELYIMGAIFARLGWLKWDKDDEDYSGRLAIKVPGTDYGYTIDFLDPISTTLAKGVAFDQELQKNGVSFEAGANLVRDYKDIFLSDQLDMFSSMKDFFDTIAKIDAGEDQYGEYTLSDGATDTVFTILNSYIPAIVRDMSRMVDPAKKVVYDTSNKRYLLNRLINSTPFRSSLVDKKDATGNTLTYTQPFTENDFFNRLLTTMSKGKLVDMQGNSVSGVKENPGSLSREDSNAFSQMAKDFQFVDENGDGFSDAHWIRDTVPSNIYPGNSQVELNPEEKDTYGKTWTDVWTSGANYLLNSDEYKNLDYENQADIIYELQGFAREVIEADYCQANELEMTERQAKSSAIRDLCTKDGKLDGEMLGLIALGNAKANKLANGGQRYVMSVQDEEGNTIKNSRQLYMRHLYEEKGVYDEVLKAIEDSEGLLEYADFGLGKTVVGYSEEKALSLFQQIYNSVFSKEDEDATVSKGKRKKKSSSTGKKEKKKKVSPGSVIRNSGTKTASSGRGISTSKRALLGSGSVGETVKPNSNFLKAYSGSMQKQSNGYRPARGATGGTMACPKCGNRVSSGMSRCPICGTRLN